MRTFVALQIPEDTKVALAQAQNFVESRAQGFYRWTPLEREHLTLYFLGDLEPDQLSAVEQALSNLEGSAFSLQIGGLVLLPEPNVPKIMAAGVTSGEMELKRLQQRIADTVFPLAQHKETRAYFPHVTLGRLKRGMPGTAKVLKRTLSDLRLPKCPAFQVEHFELIQSTLGKEGPSYETLRRFDLR